MKWEFVYYSERVQKDIHSMPSGLRHEFYAMRKIMEENGPALGMPFTRAMSNGLFEMRIRDKTGIARVFYCTVTQSEIMVLHSFIKKTQQTPDRELSIARKRLKEVQHHG